MQQVNNEHADSRIVGWLFLCHVLTLHVVVSCHILTVDLFLCLRYIEMYLTPPASRDSAKTSDWIRMRQCGIRYELAEGDQRFVDKNFIIKPKAEFEV
jgi:hypothetical protein